MNNQENALRPEDTPIGIAVRVGNIEEAQKEWFPKVFDKLQSIQDNSATKSDISRVEKEIKDIDGKLDTKVDKTDFDNHVKDENRRRWIQNTLSAVFGALLAFVLTYMVSALLSSLIGGK